jgi:hypothetical protein
VRKAANEYVSAGNSQFGRPVAHGNEQKSYDATGHQAKDVY